MAPPKPKQKKAVEPAPIQDSVTAYAKAVAEGAIIAGPHVRNACRRHLDDLERGFERGLVWDGEAAGKFFKFCETYIKLSQGDFDGKPLKLLPAQEFICGSLFGWKRSDGKRRFRRAYIEIAKGAGKSPMAAAIGIYSMLGEAQAQVYSAASMKEQSRVVFDFAVRMREQSPKLASMLTTTGQRKVQQLTYLHKGSIFKPVSMDEGMSSGPMPSCAICDELHEHKDSRVVEMMERGFKSRPNPLLFMITNSGSDRNSVCWAEHQHAVKVAAGTKDIDEGVWTYIGEPIDDSAFSYVCALDTGDDPLEDETCWVKANPLLGVTYPFEELKRVVAQAKAIPGKLNGILRLHFCVWTEADTAWMAADTIQSVMTNVDANDLKGEDAWLGVDLSATQDITAVAVVVQTGFRSVKRDDGRVHALPTYDAWVECWTPQETLANRVMKDHAPYDVWVEQGFLNTCPGRIIDTDFIAARIAGIAQEYRVRQIAYDAYSFNRYLAPALDACGVTTPLVEHPQGGKRRAPPSQEQLDHASGNGREPPQGLWMPGSVNELERLILEKRIRIHNNPVIYSAIMGAVLEADPFGNRWFSKRKATTRIDALVSLTMAVGAANSATSEPSGSSIYDFDELWEG